jgi:hypothetical protein
VVRRNNDATWLSADALCHALGWSKRRLLYELQNGLPYRTIPPGHVIDWHDPTVENSLAVEASEVTFNDDELFRELNALSTRDIVIISPGWATVGFEVLPPAAAPDDAEMSPTARWAATKVANWRAENMVSPDTPKTKAELARLLEAEAPKAGKDGGLGRPLKASYLEDWLAPWGIWPIR